MNDQNRGPRPATTTGTDQDLAARLAHAELGNAVLGHIAAAHLALIGGLTAAMTSLTAALGAALGSVVPAVPPTVTPATEKGQLAEVRASGAAADVAAGPKGEPPDGT